MPSQKPLYFFDAMMTDCYGSFSPFVFKQIYYGIKHDAGAYKLPVPESQKAKMFCSNIQSYKQKDRCKVFK